MVNPNAYEVIDPNDFGVERRIQFAHRLTGWNAIFARSKQLQLELSDDQVKAATTHLKKILADEQPITLEQVDEVLMQLSSVPLTSSSRLATFGKEAGISDLPPELAAAAKAAAEAVAQFEMQAALAAIKKVASKSKKLDDRPQIGIKLEGHLFDARVINQFMDMLVESGTCKFEIRKLDVPTKNELPSCVYIHIIANTDYDLLNLREEVKQLVKGTDCTVEELPVNALPFSGK